MAFDSFRDFLNTLDQAGELETHFPNPSPLNLEITDVDREMKSPGGSGRCSSKAHGQRRGLAVPSINTLGSWKRMAMSMGAETVDEVANELGALMKAKPPTSIRKPSSCSRSRWICVTRNRRR